MIHPYTQDRASLTFSIDETHMFVSEPDVTSWLDFSRHVLSHISIHPLKALFTLLNSIPSLGCAVFHTTVPPPKSSKKNSQPKPLEYTRIELRVVRAKKRRMSVVYEVEVVRVT